MKKVRADTTSQHNLHWYIHALACAFSIMKKHGLLDEYYRSIKKIPITTLIKKRKK